MKWDGRRGPTGPTDASLYFVTLGLLALALLVLWLAFR